MADVINTEGSLSVESLFVDGDTRTFTLKNPTANITTEQINNLNTYIQQNNLLIGDKWGGNFGRITKVTKIATITRALDFTG